MKTRNQKDKDIQVLLVENPLAYTKRFGVFLQDRLHLTQNSLNNVASPYD